MEKAKIEIRTTKKGKLVGDIIFEDGKSMPLPPGFKISEDFNNKQCEVERVNGQIKKILIDGKELEKKQQQHRQQGNTGHRNTQRYNSANRQNKSTNNSKTSNEKPPIANAPYNFVSLNEKVVFVEKPKEFNHYRGRTGYIDIEIETKTPIFIRGEGSEFYKQGGRYRIPGSSLRGMIRTLVEIASYSQFGYSLVKTQPDRRFTYRAFTDKSKNLEDDYRKYMVGGNRNEGYYNKSSAGYIKRVGLHKYVIIPAQKINNTQFYRVEDEVVVNAGLNEPIVEKHEKFDRRRHETVIKYKLNHNYKEKVIKILFKPTEVRVHQHTKVKLKYAKVTEIKKLDPDCDDNEFCEGYLFCTGYVGNQRKGKHLHWIVGPKNEEGIEIEIPNNVIDDFNENFAYKKRISGKEGKNPLSGLKVNGEPIPCFYIERDGKIKSFGFTGFYWLPYERVLKDFIQDVHKEEGLDIAKSIFGVEDKFMTRVFFEDAFLSENSYPLVERNEKTPRILAEPKPTAFQIYLKQDLQSIDAFRNQWGQIKGWKNIKSYNDSTVIRGNKLYWHINNAEWEESNRENVNRYRSQYTSIKPIKKGAKFKGKIRFENLRDVELGALLFVLNLPDGCCHKIGMAKPLGLGSVKITPKLYLSDRKERYINLFSELDGLQEENMAQFIKVFESFVLKELGTKKESLWELERLKELKKMLTFNHRIDNAKLKYMDLKQFRKRGILPSPFGI